MVLLPQAPLPLHIFEQRYREMIRDVQNSDGEFGVVLAREEGLLDTGCTARIRTVVKRYEDGRLDLVAVGERRFRIVALDRGRSYLRAEVDELEDEDDEPAPDEKVRDALLLYSEYLRVTASDEDLPEADEELLSFRLGAISPDLDFRQVLLGTLSEARRIGLVAQHLAHLLRRHALEREMKAKARSNGHAKH
jgi:Lon protease-like protein